jgi:lipopolysaccharide heptosyltransferase II
MIRRLSMAGFDAAAIFTVYSQNPLPAALLCYLADIPLRLAHCRENPYQLLTDWVREPEPQEFVRHEARRHLDLVAAVGMDAVDDRLRLRVPLMARRCIERVFDDLDLDPARPWLVIHPGSTAPSRRYPPEKFAEVADRLVKHDFEIVFTADESEIELITSIQGQMFSTSHSLAGKLNLGELAALIEASPLLISNNTGPVHVAAAVGSPVVDLYALTNPQHTPWRVPHRVLFHDVPCKYCYKSVCPEGHHDCLRRVEPEAVVQAALDLFVETGSHEGFRHQGAEFSDAQAKAIPLH